MGKKMYYTEEETMAKLSVSKAELVAFVNDGKIRVFQDGESKMYRVSEIDAMTPPEEETIELSPADSVPGDMVSITEDDEEDKPESKEDTVITSEGISIFDDEDLNIEDADPMAKTQIAPSLDEQLAGEGAGSGSGLLDLTRESDDTSLGSVLDDIDMGTNVGAELAAEAGDSMDAPMGLDSVEPVVVAQPAQAEVFDSSSGLFSGFAIGCALVALLLATVAMPLMRGMSPPRYVQTIHSNLAIFLVVAVVIIGIAGVVGLLVGKSASSRRATTNRVGG